MIGVRFGYVSKIRDFRIFFAGKQVNLGDGFHTLRGLGDFKLNVSNVKKRLVCLGYIGDETTTQLCGAYNNMYTLED